jgi:hypothetical protein
MVQCIVHAVVAVTVYTIIYIYPWDRKAAGHGMIKTTDLKLVLASPLIHKYAAYRVVRIHNYAEYGYPNSYLRRVGLSEFINTQRIGLSEIINTQSMVFRNDLFVSCTFCITAAHTVLPPIVISSSLSLSHKLPLKYIGDYVWSTD